MKLPFSFATKFILRLVLPGFFLAMFLLPVVLAVLRLFHFKIDLFSVSPLLTLLCGWAIVLFDMPIYMMYEGRRYWPDGLREWFMKREKRRLDRLVKLSDENSQNTAKYKSAPPRLKWRYMRIYLEAWVERRYFPMNAETGEYYVGSPTRLGNLIMAYEDYPYRCYGLDPVFFWYRIWLKMSKDLRDDLDDQQALADSSIYVSFILYVSAILMLMYGLVSMFGYDILDNSGPVWSYFAASASLGMVAYAVYRVSLHVHAQYGEFFKAVFDRFGSEREFGDAPDNVGKVRCRQAIDYYDRIEKNVGLWRYLHNFRIRSPWDNTLVPVSQWNAYLSSCIEHNRIDPIGDRDGETATDGVVAVTVTITCSGTDSQSTHCRTKITFHDNEEAVCPHCNARFSLNIDLKGTPDTG